MGLPSAGCATPHKGIRTILGSGIENLTDRQLNRLAQAIAADDRQQEVWVAWQCAQRVRAVYHATTPAHGRFLAETILDGFPSCSIPEIAHQDTPAVASRVIGPLQMAARVTAKAPRCVVERFLAWSGPRW